MYELAAWLAAFGLVCAGPFYVQTSLHLIDTLEMLVEHSAFSITQMADPLAESILGLRQGS